MRWISGTLMVLLVAGCSPPPPAVPADIPEEPLLAAESVYTPPPLNRATPLRAVLQEIVASQAYELPPPPGPAPASTEDLEAIRTEMAGLRQEIADLRSELNEYLGELTQGLQADNELLREELARRGSPAEPAAEAGPLVPAPGGDATVEDPTPEPLVAPEPSIDLPEPESPPRPFVFTSVKEWGRSPEQAAKQPGGVSSLFGMVGAVPRGSREEDLLGLAKELRGKYGDYDNINIEVFDDPAAAQAYADTQKLDRAHRVLSVSKHAASKRDAVLLYRNGAPIDVTQPGLPAEEGE